MWSSGAGSSRNGFPPEFFFVAPEAVSTFDPNTAIGVIPLLTAAPYQAPPPPVEDEILSLRSNIGFGMHLWQQQQQEQQGQSSSSSKKAVILEASNTTISCQDCGNQAKKDCSHRRCRTCCKSRGFGCTTHVKSTWVPAARRRDRACATTVSSPSTSSSKKQRLGGRSQTTTATSPSNTTPPRSFDTISSHHQGNQMPGQVRAPAVFKCVRVTALNDDEDQYAYQAVVRIGGHVFRGFLYDHGVETRHGHGLPNISDLHLGGGGVNTDNAACYSSHLALHHADMYAGDSSSRAGIGGLNYENP